MADYTTLATVGGFVASEATFHLPYTGTWSMRATVLTEEVLTGAVDVVYGGLSFKGNVVRGALHGSVFKCIVIGGTSSFLSRILTPRHYFNPVVRILLADVLQEVQGPSLSASILGEVLNYQLVHWTRTAHSVGKEFSLLASQLGTYWYINGAGEVVFGARGAEVYTGDYLENYVDGQDNKCSVVLSSYSLLPGMTFQTKPVASITHFLTENEAHTEVFWQ